MALTWEEVQAGYHNLWAAAKVRPEHEAELQQTCAKINAHKSAYLAVEQATGVPWWVVGCLDTMEGGGGAHTHLHNGDPLSARTVHVPAGRPPSGEPPFTFLESAKDALHYDGLTQVKDWSIPRFLWEAERYNGLGYMNKGVNSPYVWSYTTEYGTPPNVGKYVADGEWDGGAISHQQGVAAILKVLNPEIVQPPIQPPVEPPIQPPTPPTTVDQIKALIDAEVAKAKADLIADLEAVIAKIKAGSITVPSVTNQVQPTKGTSIMGGPITTTIGAGSILAALGTLFTGLSKGTLDPTVIGTLLSAAMSGLGLIFAKDHNVTGGTKSQ